MYREGETRDHSVSSVARSFSSNTQEAGRQVDLCESEVSVIYRVSSRTARATQRNLVLKNKQTKTKRREMAYSLEHLVLLYRTWM